MSRPQTSEIIESEVMDAFEVAKLLGCGHNLVYEYAARGSLPHRKLGRKIFFSRTAILRWLNHEHPEKQDR